METKRLQSTIRYIAQQSNMTEAEVVEEIDATIREAVERARRENNKAVLEKWKEIPAAGEIPSAYELIDHLGKRLVRENPFRKFLS